jgi:hypothetical protein
MSRRTVAGMSVACAVLLVPVTGCSSDHPESKNSSRPTRSSASPSAVSSPTPSTTRQETQKPPELDAGETLAGRQPMTTGHATFGYAKGKKGDALILAVRCKGTGKIKVEVPSVHVSFPLECLASKTSTTYNQVAVSGAERSGTVSVEATSAVHWSMTVGRGTPAEEEPSTPTNES